MKILRDDEVPAPPDAESYQETQWTGLFVGLGLFGTAAPMIAWSLATDGWKSPWLISVVGIVALVVLLIGRFALRTFLASRRPESWRVRWDPSGLYLRFRSYLNNGFPANTPAVVHLAPREVGWLRVQDETLETPDEDGDWSLQRKHRWLEIGVKNLDLDPLRDALAEEAKRRTLRGARVNDFPLSVTRDGTLRLQLRSPEILAHRLRLAYSVVLPEESQSVGFDDMSPGEKEDHVLALAAAGDKFAAIKAARAVYGFDLAEAKAFVEDLQARGDSAGPKSAPQ